MGQVQLVLCDKYPWDDGISKTRLMSHHFPMFVAKHNTVQSRATEIAAEGESRSRARGVPIGPLIGPLWFLYSIAAKRLCSEGHVSVSTKACL